MSTTDQLPEPDLGYIQTDKSNQPAFSARQMREAVEQARAQVQGEPVAWLQWLYGPVRLFLNKDEAMMELDRLNREYPLDADDRKMRPLILGDTTPQPAQATQAEVTDEQILEIAEPFGEFQYGDAQGHKRIDFARAILALRPERVPMTNEQWDDVLGSAGPDMLDLAKQWADNKVHVYQVVNEAEKIVKAAVLRGITAQAKKEQA